MLQESLRRFWTQYSVAFFLFMPWALAATFIFLAFTTDAWYWKSLAGWEMLLQGIAAVLVTRQYRRTRTPRPAEGKQS